jgi:Domain of unknown function (DUF4129)
LRSAPGCVIVAAVAALPAWTLLGASLVIGLAALVRMSGPVPANPEDIAGIIRLPGPVTGSIATLFTLAALVFLVGLVRRLRSARSGEEDGAAGPEAPRIPPWLRALNQILSLVYSLVLAYLLWRGAGPLAGMLSQGLGAASGIAPTLSERISVGAPPLVTWTFGVLAVVAGVAALALALWVAFADRLAEWWQGETEDPPLPPLAAAVEESLEDLRAEPDARRAIIRCYARFERVAAGSGLQRKPWLTPMEFMREALPRLPVPRGALPTLTSLFELARFSRRALGPAERDRALDALDAIKAAIEAERADAVPS